MSSKDPVGSFHLFDWVDFSPFEEEKTIKLRLNDVKILEQSFCNAFDLVHVIVRHINEADPEWVAATDGQSLQIERFSQPVLPQIIMLIVELSLKSRDAVIEAGSSNDLMVCIQDSERNEGPA